MLLALALAQDLTKSELVLLIFFCIEPPVSWFAHVVVQHLYLILRQIFLLCYLVDVVMQSLY